jgi:2-polyprenyl-6-methoxyphenol hydroxylase-like FAD-dependent oxidoreductase
VAYRGLIPAERVKNLNVEVNGQRWMGPGKHIVIYYVSAKRLLNFVGIVEQNTWTDESWTDRGDVKDLRTAFADWDPNLRAIIETIDETFIWALFDRTPLPRWSVGRVTLLGDAAHPMLPFMAQGAAQALEDGMCAGVIETPRWQWCGSSGWYAILVSNWFAPHLLQKSGSR